MTTHYPVSSDKRYPIFRDSRYTIDKEYCGHPEPRYVLRFCGDFIAQSEFLSPMIVRAVGHNSERLGSPVITEQAPP